MDNEKLKPPPKVHHLTSGIFYLQPVLSQDCQDCIPPAWSSYTNSPPYTAFQLSHSQTSASVSGPVSNSPIISQPWSIVNLQQACTHLNATGSSSSELIIIAFSDFVILLFIFNQKWNNMFWRKRIKHGAMQIFSLSYRAPDWATHKN